MFGTVIIKGEEYELTGNPSFEMENGKEVAYVTMYQGEDGVFIAKYLTENEEFINGFSNPISIEMVAGPEFD